MKLLLILCALIYQCKSHLECNNPVVIPRSTSINQAESTHHRSRRAPQNIRIARYYDSSFTSLSNSDAITSKVIDPAIQFWQNSLFVNNPLTSPLLIDRECIGGSYSVTVGSNKLKVCNTTCATRQFCYTTQIPNDYIQQCYISNEAGGYTASGSAGTGIANADMLLLIAQKYDGCTVNESISAIMTVCLLEETFDRPVLGLLSICPGKNSLGAGLRLSIAHIKHEIAHGLGLLAQLYAFYRNSSGAPLTPRDNRGVPNLGFKYLGTTRIYQYSDITIKDYNKTFNYPTGPSTKTVSYLVTPTVTMETRNHFNCPTLEGLMFEDYEPSLSHFEKLYLQSELMTASISIIPKASRLTLAALQDTGWYVANFANAEDFTFGKNIGCLFITSSCSDYMHIMERSSMSLAPYCNSPVTSEGLYCSKDRKVLMYCDLIDSSVSAASIPAKFKYFTNRNMISLDPYVDYCPFISEYALYSSTEILHTAECTDPQNSAFQGNKYDFFNQGFGYNSICLNFPSPKSWSYERCGSSFQPRIQGAGCYQYQCLQNYGLIIVVNKLQYQCLQANITVDVTSPNSKLIAHGKVICPSCSSLCDASICNSVSSSMGVPCNNVDRLCPWVTGYSVPCSAVTMKLGLLNKLLVIMFASKAMMNLVDMVLR